MDHEHGIVIVVSPVFFCAKMHSKGERAAFIKYVTWLYFDIFIALMHWKHSLRSVIEISSELPQHYSELYPILIIFYHFFSFLLTLLHLPDTFCICVTSVVCTGYGFVDFDSPAAAQKAVASLKASGVQAQMAKVSSVTRSSLWSD